MTEDRGRRITIDSNVIIASVFSKRDTEDSTSKRVIIKCRTVDIPMITDIIVDECIRRTRRSKSKATTSEMIEELNNITLDIIKLKPLPPIEELAERYKIRDKRDLQILYSADMTESAIIITQDKDFFANVEGIKARIMSIYEYDEE